MNRYAQSKESYQKLLKAPYMLIGVMTFIVILITTISIYRLYTIGVEQQLNRLSEVVQGQAVMINIIAEHEIHDHKNSKMNEIEEEVIDELMKAHKQFTGFGETGEYTLAKLNKDKIHFLLRHRHAEVDNMDDVSIEHSQLAEPMRRALNGKIGAFIGKDYRNATVLAAYTPINILGWGIVAKIDLSEIRAPYIKEILYSIVGAVFIILFGSIVIVRFIHPLLKEIEQSREYNRMLFNESPIGFALTDFEGNMIDVNPALLKITGYTEDQLLNLSYWDITPQKYKQHEHEHLKKLLNEKCYGPYEKEYYHKDGHLINVRLSGCLIEKNMKRYIWSSIEDISEHVRNIIALKEAALVFENTHEGILITDENVKVVRINTRFTKITGYTFDEVVGLNPNFLQSGAHDEEFYKNIWKTIQENGSWYGELNDRKKNGEYFATMQSITAIKDDNSKFSGYVSVFSDISDRKTYESNLLHLASHDALTSLPNRTHFHDNLRKAIQNAKRNKYKIAVLFLDLNDFKKVNDTLGHEVGDALLKEVSNRLKDCLRGADTVARLGGDEFAIVLQEIKSIDNAVEVAQKIIQKVSEPFKVGEEILIPSTSIGISIYPEHSDDGDKLLKLADKAMYVAKQRKDGTCELFDLNKNYE
ncbi:MAG: diguanylate cyclase [Sulfurimonas sp.]|jgi:diguanylate cyclase (GGDEF)-like protein/PAS domain S-box-containing protein